MRSGRGALDAADWALHVHAEGVDGDAANTTLSHIREICCKTGVEVSPNVAIALNARPYSIRGFVGLEGERFVPIHAMFPLSRATAAAARIEQFFADHERTFEEHQITTCCLAGMEQGVFVVEPMFYWPDQLGPLHRRYLPSDKFVRLNRGQPNPEGRRIVIGLREELRQIFFDLGAIHGQIREILRLRERAEARGLRPSHANQKHARSGLSAQSRQFRMVTQFSKGLSRWTSISPTIRNKSSTLLIA